MKTIESETKTEHQKNKGKINELKNVSKNLVKRSRFKFKLFNSQKLMKT